MLNKILDFDGLKYPQAPLVGQPQGYGLALIKYAKQFFIPMFYFKQTKQWLVCL